MEQYKKDTLAALLKKLNDEISTLYHAIENDQDNISDDKFREYEKQIENLQQIHSELEQEVYFS
ncbi:hypothetical protein V7128_01490 [Neobacillus vireti]|uniref:hypothetical protein n=1 Tax=Neobacillus vireti TaxID=220686 RepID=UPI002FFE30FA